jgi:acylphosphatase
MKGYRILISGRVQGIGFRYFAYRNAIKYNIKGYVRNLAGGDVEIVAVDENQNLEEFLQKIRTGPPAARIYDITIEELPETTNYDSFQIRF